MAKLLVKGQLGLIKGGEVLGAFSYVENLADGIILAGVVKAAAGQAYILTDGVELSWKDYFTKLTRTLDLPGPRFRVPVWMARFLAAFLETIHRLLHLRARPLITRYLVAHLEKDFHFSIEKARRELDYQPAVGIDAAIQRTADWFRKVVKTAG
jgi:nucleoside-diphosphate-sugar epimerase